MVVGVDRCAVVGVVMGACVWCVEATCIGGVEWTRWRLLLRCCCRWVGVVARGVWMSSLAEGVVSSVKETLPPLCDGLRCCGFCFFLF